MNIHENYKELFALSKSYLITEIEKNQLFPCDNKDLLIYESDHLSFKEIIMDHKIFIQTPKAIGKDIESFYAKRTPQWSGDFYVLNQLNNILNKCQLEIDETKIYFLPYTKNAINISKWQKNHPEIEIQIIDKKEILQLESLRSFHEAFLFDSEMPDEIGVIAKHQGRIIAASGATSDSDHMWQMGIDVDRNFRCDSLGAVLIQILTDTLLEKGIIPYYGTVVSHIASQKVALKAGFKPSWFEITSRKL